MFYKKQQKIGVMNMKKFQIDAIHLAWQCHIREDGIVGESPTWNKKMIGKKLHRSPKWKER